MVSTTRTGGAEGGRRRHRCRSDRGAALIEFAIIFPILAMLVFGMLTGGIVMNKQAVAVERSGGQLSADDVCVALMDGTTVTASTDGVACIAGDINTGQRVQVSATLPEQEINAIIVRVPVSIASDATAKFEE
jgi:hypothetical protein